MRLILRLTSRVELRREDGFTMVLAIAALFLVTAMSVAAFAAINNDQPLTRNDSYQKQSYAAAQAGVQQYLFDLNQNNQFWTQCAPSGNTGALNQAGSTSNTRAVPGAPNESYAIELMPAAGQSTYSQCSTSNPVASMIQSQGSGAGSLRIRATGTVKTGTPNGVKRTIVASLRESTFLDYVWFTKYETDDPSVQLIASGCSPSSCPRSSWSTALAGAQAQCGQYYRDGRTSKPFYTDSSGVKHYCDQIFFASADDLQGSVYTDDEFAICGTPTFGRNGSDTINIGAPAPGESNQGASGCPSSPRNSSPPINNAALIAPPATDAALQTQAAANGIVFTGPTCIKFGLSSTQFQAAQPPMGDTCLNTPASTWLAYNYPSNGVMYVQNSSTNPCTITYNDDSPDYTVDNTDSGCGIAYVQGTYSQAVTVGTANDIVINGNVTYSGSTSLLGLVANGFVRVYHPCNSTDLSNPTIDAAILSVAHSFIVDNYQCGGSEGELNVFGSIAQLYRGGVGKNQSGVVVAGYAKNYVYDDRLMYEEPPDFLDPVSAAWRVVRENECYQTPASGSTAANTC